MGEFRMPALGAGMDVGRVLEWYVAPGDEVGRGDLVALVQTDKADIDVEVFEDGVVAELLVGEGTKVPVGTPLARISPAGAERGPEPRSGPERPPGPASSSEPEPASAADGVTAPDGPEGARIRGGTGAHVMSPLVRRLVKEADLDLAQVRGTGPGGTVTRDDVAAAAGRSEVKGGRRAPTPRSRPDDGLAQAPAGLRSSPYARRLVDERGHDPASLTATGPGGVLIARDVPPAPGGESPDVHDGLPAAVEPSAGRDVSAGAGRPGAGGAAMRQAIARAMERANREIPHYYLREPVDLEQTLDWLEARNRDRAAADRLLPAVLILRAVALALRDHPEFNGHWVEGAFVPGDGIHLGIAIHLRRGGLLAPAIRDADERSLDGLMEALKDLVQRTRAGGLRGSELTDPTITVSNLGDTGVEGILGVITPPQVALVGVGRITERPWAIDGMLAVRRVVELSLAADHRASDGHRGGRFLAAIAANLGRPETL